LYLLFALSAAASAVNLVNDLGDLDTDRRHPRKSARPLASGQLSVLSAVALAPVLLLLAMILGWRAGDVSIVAIYALVALSYSLALKEWPLLDLFALAALYSLRLVGGGIVTHHPVSKSLLVFSSFLFFSLAAVRRVSELMDDGKSVSGVFPRRGYSAADLPIMITFGVASSFSSCIVLALYVQGRVANVENWSGELLWGIVPLLLFWQCRLWLATSRGYVTDDPIVYAAQDWVTWIVVACTVAIYVVRAFGLPSA